jgi:hypothetical protein
MMFFFVELNDDKTVRVTDGKYDWSAQILYIKNPMLIFSRMIHQTSTKKKHTDAM